MCRPNLHSCCDWSRSESARKSKSVATIIESGKCKCECNNSEVIWIQLCAGVAWISIYAGIYPGLKMQGRMQSKYSSAKKRHDHNRKCACNDIQLIWIQLSVTCMCCQNLNFCCNWSRSENAKRSKTRWDYNWKWKWEGSSAVTVTVNWSVCIQRQLYLTSATKAYHSWKSRNHVWLQILYSNPLISLLLR